MASSRSTASRNLGTIAAAADQYGCNPRTIRRYIASGRLTAYRMGPRLIRVDLDQLDGLLSPLPTGSNGPAAA